MASENYSRKWDNLTTLMTSGASAPPAKAFETPRERQTRYADALGVSAHSAEPTAGPAEITLDITDAVSAAGAGYARNAAPVVERSSAFLNRIAEGLDEIDARASEIIQETPAARASLDDIEHYLEGSDLSSPIQGDVDVATTRLFGFAGAYDQGSRRLRDAYDNVVPDVRSVGQCLAEVGEEAGRAHDQIEVRAQRYTRNSPSGLFAAEHAAPLAEDMTTARQGAGAAEQLEATVQDSVALRALPDATAMARQIELLVGRLRGIGNGEEYVSPQQLRHDIADLKERITAVESGAGDKVTSETNETRHRLDQINQAVERLNNSPLLQEK